ncbi:MAG: patatin-like phospholipase family protein [Anaerolineales bacterium]|nr:MAG: patatin-like phospholipase family protein [Anaerolineales bacterium]
MRLLDLLLGQTPPERRQRIGLVLSGGAVRGAAHLGVLQVLGEAGIRPDLVVGVSAGSVVGGLYCAGLSPRELQKMSTEMNWRRLARITRPGLGFFDISQMEQFIDKLVGSVTIEELAIPFAAVAVDILTGELVVFRQGSLARAIRASCSLPGIFSPLEDGKRLLIDGGALNNLPVGVARDMGANYLIAVDLLPPPLAPMQRPHNISEMWSLSFYTIMRARYTDARVADVVIQPDIAHVSFIDFGQTDYLVQKGREGTLAQLERIKSDLGMTT